VIRWFSAGVFASAAFWANLACFALIRDLGSPEAVRLATIGAAAAAGFGGLALLLPDHETRGAKKATSALLGLVIAAALGGWAGGAAVLSGPGLLAPAEDPEERLSRVDLVARDERPSAVSFRSPKVEIGGEFSARQQTRRVAARPGTPFRGEVPRHADRLLFGVAAPTPAPATGRVVVARVDDGEVVHAERIEIAGQHSGWQDVTVDVAQASGQLEIRIEPADGALVVSEPAFLRPAAGLRPRNLILISLDTVRADILGAYGYERFPTSPNFDALAARGTLFENHIAASPWTKPSHLALLTGTPPDALGMGGLMGSTPRLARQRTTLAEMFRDAGYLSVAFTGSGTMSAQHGFSDGFYLYQESYNDEEVVMRDFDTNAYLALEWLADAPPAPTFLFFHSFEPHDPYVHRRFVSPDVSPLELPVVAYASGIGYSDAALGGLLDDLEGLGLLEDSIVVVTSDHGEAFGKPPRRYHGRTLFDDVVRPPLLLLGEGIPEGRRVTAQVPSVDLLATVAELFGLPTPPDVDSRSLVPLILCCLAHRKPMVGIRSDGFKYILTLEKDGSRSERLFDLTADPLEQVNVVEAYGGVAARLREKLLAALERNQRRAEGEPGERLELDSRMRRQLEALGYIE
jgi:arylsulfatase A-like enzyme